MEKKFDQLSKENREFYDSFHKKARAGRLYFKEYDYFLEIVGNHDGKVILSIGNGDKKPFFEDTIVSDISVEALLKVGSAKRCVFDVHFMPLKPESVDIVYGWQVVHHFDIDKLLPELKLVLKKGGRAVFVDNGYGPQWRLLRKLLPKKKVEPAEDLKEEYLQAKVEYYGLKNFKSKRFNFFAYLINKLMRDIGLNVKIRFFEHLDDFCSRWKMFRDNLRNMVWSLEK